MPVVASTEKQNLLTFNVPSEVQEKISTLMEGSGVLISSEYHPLNSDVMVYVIGSPAEITFLPQVLTGADVSETPTEPFDVKVLDATTTAGDKLQVTFVLAVRHLVPQMSDETFNCTTARLASAAMISRATGSGFQDVLRTLQC